MAPLATIDEVASINASIGLPIGPDETSWRRVARAYVWAVAPIAVPAAIGALVGVTIGGPMALLLVPAGLAALVLRYAEWRHTRFALDGSTLFIERGWWRHRRLVLPVRRIQSIDIAENFWTRRLGYCALQLGIAGGNGLSVHAIPALTRVDAEALRGQLLTA
ncbi:PH domain-containing protein [Sphingomonas jaspsi]|uniref:PH domain-containing protein n=1 Tax=Sphingomonas jaspsi TaxID=392409 RepID=UPI000564825F|nr:PH domain-containing protein [Sphingomonas jaspsi]